MTCNKASFQPTVLPLPQSLKTLSSFMDPAEARRQVNNAIAHSDSATIGRLVDAALSYQRKRLENQTRKTVTLETVEKATVVLGSAGNEKDVGEKMKEGE
ncbi:hypothetical protein ACMFMG_011033 [Clarireedia jacksonii]